VTAAAIATAPPSSLLGSAERRSSVAFGDGRIPSAIAKLDDLEVEGRRVLVRCDLNVPLKDGQVADDMRIRASLPTLEELLERGARLVVCSHLGRPKGKVVEELRLRPVGTRLADLLGREVAAVEDVIGDGARKACASDAPVVLLENLRFEAGEEANDPSFSGALADLADVYVNDAFGSCHRAHASVVGVTQKLPGAAGRLLFDEVDKLSRLLGSPEQPFVVVLGGAKVADKLGVIEHLLPKVQHICVGGAMAFTLLAARGEDVGKSRVEEDRVGEVREVLEQAQREGVEVLLPNDVIAAAAPESGARYEPAYLHAIGDRYGVDIGPETRAAFSSVIRAARTLLWNGPMGIFEIEEFAGGSRAVAASIAQTTKAGAFTVAGGGDSAAALEAFGMTDAVSHLSTGGGASLEFLSGADLPGIAALER
jgi:phosphoglycerate kinase